MTSEPAAVEIAESVNSSQISHLSTNMSPFPPIAPKDCEVFIEAAFKDISLIHSHDTCTKKSCLNLSKQEMNRQRTGGSKDRFKHQWVFDPNVAFCQKTGYLWLLYEEGAGMFCMLCKKHNAVNLQKKSKKFNTDSSVRFKRTAIIEHGNSQQQDKKKLFIPQTS